MTTKTLFLAGDVMTGRGVDQLLPYPSPPQLHERYVTDARDYVRLAERVSGPLPRGVAADYVWGEALSVWARVVPAARLVNLETSITRSDDYEDKGINYRMRPENVDCLRAARFDICALANNHVLDYGPAGLVETLDTLERAGIRPVGAGRNAEEAARPVVHPLGDGGRLIVGACAHHSSGVPEHWAARGQAPGVHLLPDLTARLAAEVAAPLTSRKAPGDVAVLSIHWGGNWGYEVPGAQVEFAHRLVDAGIDVVHGHSSHHVRPIEVYHDRLVLYGCGDFLDDYEGISGHERYRGDLVLMFLPSVDAETGQLLALDMVPLQIRGMRLQRLRPADGRWMAHVVTAISRPFGTALRPGEDGGVTWIPGDRAH